MTVRTLKFSQLVPTSREKAWEFFSNPNNLSRITPSSLDFKILSDPPREMYEGLFIHYTVRPLLGIPMKWVTEITHVRAPDYFVDEQRYGPYKIWHHEHHFREVPEGVLMEDVVNLQVGYGPLDAIILPLVVIPQVHKIFEYRSQVVSNLFPTAR